MSGGGGADMDAEPLAGASSSSVSLTREESAARTARLVPLRKVWYGRATPCCSGTFLCGPDPGVLMCNVFLVVGGTAVFLAFVALEIHVVVFVGVLLSLLVVEWALFKTSWTEPGIVARGPAAAAPMASPPQGDLRGRTVDLKWCRTCHVYRPPRARHCRECDVCVKEHDHHCPWVSNCVGERNYRYFVLFIFALTTHITIVFVACAGKVIADAATSSLSDSVGNNPAAFLMLIVTFVFGWCLWSLSGYHCFVMSQGLTTAENLTRNRRGNDVVAENIGCCGACARIFFTPQAESEIALRSLVDPRQYSSRAPGSSSRVVHDRYGVEEV